MSRDKDAGDSAYKAQRYDDAIRYYSDAVANSTDRDILKTVHSNRSAAYLKAGGHSNELKALADARKCIELDSSWDKGIRRKGDALFSLKRYVEAYNTYNSVLTLVPNDPSSRDKMNQMQVQINNSVPGAPYELNDDRITTIHTYIRMIVVGCAIGYLLPIRSISASCHRIFLFASLANYAIALYKNHGTPKFSKEFAQSLLQMDPQTPLTMSVALQFMAHPYFLAMLPLLLYELAYFLPYATDELAQKKPELLVTLSKYMDQYLPMAIGCSKEEWNSIPLNTKWNNVNTLFLKLAAVCEVMLGIYVIIEIFLPTRSFIFLYLWWQYLQMRYLLDKNGSVKEGFAHMDAQIMGPLNHKYCPQIIRTGYAKIKQFLQNQLPQPGQPGRPASAIPRCTIM